MLYFEAPGTVETGWEEVPPPLGLHSEQNYLQLSTNVCVPQYSYVEILIPNAILGIRCGPFDRWLGHEGRAVMNKISTLVRNFGEIPIWGHKKTAVSEQGPGLIGQQTGRCLDLRLFSLWNCGKYISDVYKPLSLWYYVIKTQMS